MDHGAGLACCNLFCPSIASADSMVCSSRKPHSRRARRSSVTVLSYYAEHAMSVVPCHAYVYDDVQTSVSIALRIEEASVKKVCREYGESMCRPRGTSASSRMNEGLTFVLTTEFRRLRIGGGQAAAVNSGVEGNELLQAEIWKINHFIREATHEVVLVLVLAIS